MNQAPLIADFTLSGPIVGPYRRGSDSSGQTLYTEEQLHFCTFTTVFLDPAPNSKVAALRSGEIYFKEAAALSVALYNNRLCNYSIGCFDA